MSILGYQLKNTEVRVNNPTLDQVEECINALDNWDRSGVKLTVGKQFLLITGGTKDNLVGVTRLVQSMEPVTLIDPQLFLKNVNEETIFCLQYQQSEMPIKYTVPRHLAVQAVRDLMLTGKYSKELQFLSNSKGLLHGDELECPD